MSEAWFTSVGTMTTIAFGETQAPDKGPLMAVPAQGDPTPGAPDRRMTRSFSSGLLSNFLVQWDGELLVIGLILDLPYLVLSGTLQ